MKSTGRPVRPAEGVKCGSRYWFGVLVIGALLWTPASASGDTITVNSQNDGGGTCTPGSEVDCSFRQAVATASSGDTIEFHPSVSAITLTTGNIEITQNLTIAGPGAGQLSVSGNNSSRVFNITSGTVLISGLTIWYGDTGGDGGGINNSGILTVENSIFTGNHANDDGGALSNDGIMIVTNCTLSENTATDKGGGINNNDLGVSLTVTNSTFADNPAGPAAAGSTAKYR